MNSYESNLLFKLGNGQFYDPIGYEVIPHKTITYGT